MKLIIIFYNIFHQKNIVDMNLYYLGWEDSNLRMAESKSAALPLGYTPTKSL